MKGTVDPAMADLAREASTWSSDAERQASCDSSAKLLGGMPKFTHYRRRRTNKAPRKRTFVMFMTKYPSILMKTVGTVPGAGGGGGGGRLKSKALPRAYLHTSGIAGLGVGEGFAGNSLLSHNAADLKAYSSAGSGLLLITAALSSAALYVQQRVTTALVTTVLQKMLENSKQAAAKIASKPKSPFASAFAQVTTVSSELQSAFSADFGDCLSPAAGMDCLSSLSGSVVAAPTAQNSEVSAVTFGDVSMLMSRSNSVESEQDYAQGAKRLRLQDGNFAMLRSSSLASSGSIAGSWNSSFSSDSLSSPYQAYNRRVPFTLHVHSTPAGSRRAAGGVITCRKVIGSGAYGRVYRATWNGRTVAVKMPADEVLHNQEDAELTMEDVLASFSNEAQVLAHMASHENILAGEAVQTTDGATCIVSDYASWGTLSQYLHQAPGRDWAALEELVLTRLAQQHGLEGSAELLATVAGTSSNEQLPLAPRRFLTTLALLQQAARGLEHLGSAGVVHRDFKPDNILINSDGVALICDFGLAQVTTAPSAMTERHGTPQYSAPEELRPGQVANATAAADIFSFGYCLWEALSSSYPWEAVPAARVMYTVGQQDARLAVPDCWPASVKGLLAACWQEQPQARPTATQVTAALEAQVSKLVVV